MTDISGAQYFYYASYDGDHTVTVARVSDANFDTYQRYDVERSAWIIDDEIDIENEDENWNSVTVDEADSLTERRAFGLDGTPPGDPGYTVAIDLDVSAAEFDESALQSIRLSVSNPVAARVRSGSTGHAQIVVDIPHTGWFAAGAAGVTVARHFEAHWPILAVQICRTDLWNDGEQAVHWLAPNFAEVLDSRPDDCVLTLEVVPNPWAGQDLDRYSLPGETSYPTSTGSGSVQLNIPRVGRNCVDEAEMSSETAHFLSNEFSIVRIRVSHIRFYRDEYPVSGSFPATAPPSETVSPGWHFGSFMSSERFVVITDLEHDFTGWAVEVTQDDDLNMVPISAKTLYRNESEDFNLHGQGETFHGFAASVEPGAQLIAFVTASGARIEIDSWTYMIEWLEESLADQPSAPIIDLGPNDYIPSEDDENGVVCAQLIVMADDVFMVRRSRVELGHLMFADYSTKYVELDRWYLTPHFDDCTDGYLFTKDRRLAAETCVTWFRDNQGASEPGDIGCDYSYPDELLPSEDSTEC